MLKKAERVSQKEFSHYFKAGKRNNSEYLTIITFPNKTFKGSVVVGKKVYKDAVSRNRLRRQVYEMLRGMVFDKNQVVLVLCKPTLTKLTNVIRKEALKAELGRVLN